MKILVTILLTLLMGLPAGASDNLALQNIQGLDVVSGKKFELTFPTAKPVAVVFLSAKCPCSESHEAVLKKLHSDFENVQLLGLHSNADEEPTEVQEHFQKANLPFPVIKDVKNYYANLWGALKTPHAFVLDTHGQVLYQGGVTDSRTGPKAKTSFLREVFSDLRDQKPLRYKEGRALGCYIQREKQ